MEAEDAKVRRVAKLGKSGSRVYNACLQPQVCLNVDTVYNLGILSRDIYLAIWIVLFVLLGIYLGQIKFLT